MVDIKKITGRLGNQMFEFAALYAYAKDMGVDYYFQSPEWFEKYQDEIRRLYSQNISSSIDKVAIHVRRASNPLDYKEPKYSENPFYVNLCDTDYYERAIDLFPNDKFMVFSDDKEWCYEKWGDDKRFEISAWPEIEDMNYMASCKAHIIANSSFSWWGAWLSPLYPHNRVIAPKEWYADGIERTKLPSHWERI